jgi:hypothetical protein
VRNAVFLRKVVLRGLGLFIAVNLVFASFPPRLGEVSLYNRIFPGRTRFPYGENPAESYNLSLFDLDAMFASHVISAGTKPENEYRVVLIGDSALWGWLLRPEETLAGQLDAVGLTTCDGRRVRVYNLGYPEISLTKDLLILDQAMDYQPDLVLWLMTLKAFPVDRQLILPFVANNAARVDSLITRYHLPLDPAAPNLVHPGFWDQTVVGQRRPLADWVRLQLYGILWAATGIDQVYPADYQRVRMDFEADALYDGMQPHVLNESYLAFPLLEAGLRVAGGTPMILVNEPILISNGNNSDIRYNSYYPRWAYDQYRQMLAGKAAAGGWNYLDLWNLVPASEFTNTPFHMTPKGESLLATQVKVAIQQRVCP